MRTGGNQTRRFVFQALWTALLCASRRGWQRGTAGPAKLDACLSKLHNHLKDGARCRGFPACSCPFQVNLLSSDKRNISPNGFLAGGWQVNTQVLETSLARPDALRGSALPLSFNTSRLRHPPSRAGRHPLSQHSPNPAPTEHPLTHQGG